MSSLQLATAAATTSIIAAAPVGVEAVGIATAVSIEATVAAPRIAGYERRYRARPYGIDDVLCLLLEQCRALQSILFVTQCVNLVLKFTLLKFAELVGQKLRLCVNFRADDVELRVCIGLDVVGLVNCGNAAFIPLTLYRGLEVAAALLYLVPDVAADSLNRVDYLLACKAYLVANALNEALDVAQRVFQRLDVAV